MPTRHSPDTCVGPCATSAAVGRCWARRSHRRPTRTRASGPRAVSTGAAGASVRVGERPKAASNAALTALEPAASRSPAQRRLAHVAVERRRRGRGRRRRHQRRRRDARRARRRHHRRRRRRRRSGARGRGRGPLRRRRTLRRGRGRAALPRSRPWPPTSWPSAAARPPWPRRSPTPPARRPRRPRSPPPRPRPPRPGRQLQRLQRGGAPGATGASVAAPAWGRSARPAWADPARAGHVLLVVVVVVVVLAALPVFWEAAFKDLLKRHAFASVAVLAAAVAALALRPAPMIGPSILDSGGTQCIACAVSPCRAWST